MSDDLFMRDWAYGYDPREECFLIWAKTEGSEEKASIMARCGSQVAADYLMNLHQSNVEKRREAAK